MLLGWNSMVRAADDKRFVTDCELSDFVKTPRYAETVAYAQGRGFTHGALYDLRSKPRRS